MFDLVAIGNPVFDEIITPTRQIPGRILSGCSTNACLAAKKLGLSKVALIGSIGPQYSTQFYQKMKQYSITPLAIKPSKDTGGFKLIYDTHGNRTLDVLGIADTIYPEDIPDEALEAKIILLAPILQEIPITLIEHVRQNSQAKLFLDPQGMLREINQGQRVIHTCDRKKAQQLASLVDVIKPNEHEAYTLTSVESPYLAARLLNEWGAQLSIVTLAEKGSVIARRRNFVRIPAYKTTALDPTGAGDTYFGAFITEYLKAKSVFNCGLFASAAASIKVEHTGPDFQLEYQDASTRMSALLP
jgi:sugar/nucleoside kinase (ribokinase family)